MLIDRTHRSWGLASAALLALAVIAYAFSALGPVRPRGGTLLGLAYGTVAFAFMLFAMLLSLRKKFPVWRIGRTQTWMRGHLWLGGLTLPLVLLHGGFGLGHGITAVMMVIFFVVYASGLLGAWLQHTMPRRLLREVPMETIYEQIGHVRRQLVDEADGIVAEACGKLEVVVAVPLPATPVGANALATVIRGGNTADVTAPLRDFYLAEMRPFLEAPSRRHALANEVTAAAMFGRIRPLIPDALHAAVADLEGICEEERQLLRQERMQAVLFSWMLVHVPLSFALMLLAAVHALMALRY